MQFTDLRLSQPILRAIEQEGYSTPTPIQRQAIPPALDGRDVLGCAQTGTGKTAAFALPILQRLSAAAPDKSHRGPRRPRALVLSPTRELALQIADSFGAYGRELCLDVAAIFGGVSQIHQEKALRRGVDIIVATPGRLLDLMDQRLVDLSRIEVFVLDEADRMLDMGFIDPIRRIASVLPPAGQRQTLLFSATMPATIVKLAHSLLRDPVKVAVDPVSSAAPKIDQAVYMVDRKSKQDLLEHLIEEHAAAKVIVFTRTKHGADKVGRRLMQAGISAETIHGNKSQNQRQRALGRFSVGKARVLVATDVAARGLDVDDITHVVNFDLPVEPEAYVHRIGRTGRAGAAGVAISFCDHDERPLLRDIERLTGRKIEVRLPVGEVKRRRPVEVPAVAAEPARAGAAHRAAGPQHHQRRARRGGGHAQPAAPAPAHAAAGGSHHAQQRTAAPSPRTSHGGWRKPSRRRPA